MKAAKAKAAKAKQSGRKIWTRVPDEKHRITLPPDIPTGSEVTIQQIDAFTYVVKLPRPDPTLKMVLIPVIDRLPDDPEWEKVENAFASAAYKSLRRHPPEGD